MLPTNLFVVTGAANGTPIAGPFTVPEIVVETNQPYLIIDEDVWLRDAIAHLATGAAFVNLHFFVLAVGDTQHRAAVIYSSQIPPNSNLRQVPRLFFKRGTILYMFDGQFGGGGAEAGYLELHWSKEKPPLKSGN